MCVTERPSKVRLVERDPVSLSLLEKLVDVSCESELVVLLDPLSEAECKMPENE